MVADIMFTFPTLLCYVRKLTFTPPISKLVFKESIASCHTIGTIQLTGLFDLSHIYSNLFSKNIPIYQSCLVDLEGQGQ